MLTELSLLFVYLPASMAQCCLRGLLPGRFLKDGTALHRPSKSCHGQGAWYGSSGVSAHPELLPQLSNSYLETCERIGIQSRPCTACAPGSIRCFCFCFCFERRFSLCVSTGSQNTPANKDMFVLFVELDTATKLRLRGTIPYIRAQAVRV